MSRCPKELFSEVKGIPSHTAKHCPGTSFGAAPGQCLNPDQKGEKRSQSDHTEEIREKPFQISRPGSVQFMRGGNRTLVGVVHQHFQIGNSQKWWIMKVVQYSGTEKT